MKKKYVSNYPFQIILFFLLIVFSQSCKTKQIDNKINGISLVASSQFTKTEDIQTVKKVHANWVSIMPFAFLKTVKDTILHFNTHRQWIGEKKEGITNAIQLSHNHNLKVLLKPQIWIPNGFTGHIDFHKENDWVSFEKKYESFILFYADIAEKEKVELFCIGTELSIFIQKRTAFWNILIQKIKSIYSGKITYAENWDTYQKVPFIKELDFIGIDAYFPLLDKKCPSIKELENAWQVHKKEIKKTAETFNKEVLFTEFGYQSIDYSTKNPWNYNQKEKNVNLSIQENALQALFNSFWKEKWFKGGFLWKWYENDDLKRNLSTDYTVQGKPAYETVKKQYQKHRK